MERQVVRTGLGPVDIAMDPSGPPFAVSFPGGHCTAIADTGWDLLRRAGLAVISVSRPGYGRTGVGPLSTTQFVPAVDQALGRLGVKHVAAVVGVSFGGMQAVEFARCSRLTVSRLVLCSAAPSSLPYPDSRLQRLAAPFVFGPTIERLTWAATRRLVRSDNGLRMMLASLSKLPVDQWWGHWSPTDRDRARTLLTAMASGSGFRTDLRQAREDTSAARRWSLSEVSIPTLVVGSRHDGGVDFSHAEDQARIIPGAILVDTRAPSHLFWLGPTSDSIAETISSFLSPAEPDPSRPGRH